jgi:hypothetical protein
MYADVANDRVATRANERAEHELLSDPKYMWEAVA